MNKLVFSLLAALAIAASSALPSFALQAPVAPHSSGKFEPTPEDALFSVQNARALSGPIGPGYGELGFLNPTRYLVVTVSGITNSAGKVTAAAGTTITIYGTDVLGHDHSVRRLFLDGQPQTLDMGAAVGPNELFAIWYPNQPQDALSISVNHQRGSR